MTIAYSKTEINKLKYSGLFSMVLIIVCTYFVVRDREVAVFISALPILIVILARLMRLFLFLLHYKTEETTYLELGEDTLTYHSVLDGKISIDLEQIRDIHMEEDGIFFRCVCCSMLIAQYILCAGQIQEIVNKSAMDLSVSFQSLIAISVLYIGTGILFFPSKGLGTRMIQYNIHRHNNP